MTKRNQLTLTALQKTLEGVADQFKTEEQAIPALSQIATGNGLKYSTVRRAYRTVVRLRARRKS